MLLSRRHVLAALGAAPLLGLGLVRAHAQSLSSTLNRLKPGFAQRLKRLLAEGGLPYIDIESSCDSNAVDPAEVMAAMDRLGIGLMALSADPREKSLAKGVFYDPLSQRLTAEGAEYFIPVGNGGQAPATTDDAEPFLKAQGEAAARGDIALFGEYEFRHYPSPRQANRGDEDRDVTIPLDGPLGQALFALSAQTGLPFQIHYEIEDALLPTLEKMLAQYPQAQVIWCHFAQIRYIERASLYTPAYMDSLLNRYPNLFCDTAFGTARSLYPLSGQRQARVWADDGSLKPEWLEVIVSHPTRFVSALDLGQDRLKKIDDYDKHHRGFLKELPQEVRHQVAYGNTWRLLFHEDFS